MGFFTRLQFHEPTCISSLTVHCLKPLTGAEEIDILFSECEHGHWKVMHYTNTKEKFLLKTEVVARQLSISSPIVLSIIDCTVMLVARHVCTQDATANNLPLFMSESLRGPGGNDLSNIYCRTFIETNRLRTKDSTDVVIPVNRTVTIRPGVVLRFADGAGFTVYATTPSMFKFANITGSLLGISVRSGIPPSVDNVISSSNDYGFDFQTPVSVRIVNSSALNNEKTGFRISSKVFARSDRP
ncbi:hypothetical protein OSTOST_19069 [Ostertagia ostertagi]